MDLLFTQCPCHSGMSQFVWLDLFSHLIQSLQLIAAHKKYCHLWSRA